MYTEISLHLTQQEIQTLGSGLAVKIATGNLSGATKSPVCVTSVQLKKLQRISEGKQKFCLLRLSKAAIKRSAKQIGGSFWSSVGNTLKSTFTSPSGLMGLASLVPTPLSGPLKAASVVAKLTGHGVRRKKTQLFNVGGYNASGGAGSHHVMHHHAVEKALLGMGFHARHIQHMKGSGVFSSIWSGIKKIGSVLAPYVEKEGHRLIKEYGPGLVKGATKHATDLVNAYMNGHGAAEPRYIVKFSKPQLDYIKRNMSGSGIFSDLASSIGLGFSSGVNRRRNLTRELGGNLVPLGSVK
jgi:hypothetical protein